MEKGYDVSWEGELSLWGRADHHQMTSYVNLRAPNDVVSPQRKPEPQLKCQNDRESRRWKVVGVPGARVNTVTGRV